MGKRAHNIYPLYREIAVRQKVIGSAFSNAASVSEGVSQPKISEIDKHRTPLHSKKEVVWQPYSRLPCAPHAWLTLVLGLPIKVWERKCGCGCCGQLWALLLLLPTRFYREVIVVMACTEFVPIYKWSIQTNWVVRFHASPLMLVLRCSNALCFP